VFYTGSNPVRDAIVIRMKISVSRLRQIIAEELRVASNKRNLLEGASPELTADLDAVLNGIQAVLRSLELAHQKAPDAESKTIIAGVHSDMFNSAATARQYIRQIKSKPAQQQQAPASVTPATTR
jgi:hypothetical protein